MVTSTSSQIEGSLLLAEPCLLFPDNCMSLVGDWRADVKAGPEQGPEKVTWLGSQAWLRTAEGGRGRAQTLK